jgi:hypothetical protein
MRPVRTLFLVVRVCLLVGCGDSRRKLNGKIVKGGAPFTLSDKGIFALAFFSESDSSKMYNATTKTDGTFTIVGADGKGIPAGKYKVQLTAQDPYTGPQSKDLLGGKFAKGSDSPLTVDVGKDDVTVDVGK